MISRKSVRSGLLLLVVSACYSQVIRAQAAPEAALPKVPNLPLGNPDKNLPEGDHLSPSCKATVLRSIEPCLRQIVAAPPRAIHLDHALTSRR